MAWKFQNQAVLLNILKLPHEHRVNLTQKSVAPFVATLFWACYPCRYVLNQACSIAIDMCAIGAYRKAMITIAETEPF